MIVNPDLAPSLTDHGGAGPDSRTTHRQSHASALDASCPIEPERNESTIDADGTE